MKQSGGLSSPIDGFYSSKIPAPDRKEMISSIILDGKKEDKSEAETKSVKGNKAND